MPRVSVILPVYNGESYLRPAIESVLTQSFDDLEVIAINDGSTDGSGEILESYKDHRLHVFHQQNLGLALTLNRGLALARGEYVARQDADDISLPNRIESQVSYLDSHPECGLLGTWSTIWEADRETRRGHRHPIGNGSLQLLGLFDCFFVHSSVMMRRSIALEVGGYPADPARNPPEDFDLWSRIARRCAIANLPQVLLVYREIPGSISREKADLISDRVHRIACENVARMLDLPISHSGLDDIVAIVRGNGSRLGANPDWRSCRTILRRLQDALISKFPDDKDEIIREQQRLQRLVTATFIAKIAGARNTASLVGRLARRLALWMGQA